MIEKLINTINTNYRRVVKSVEVDSNEFVVEVSNRKFSIPTDDLKEILNNIDFDTTSDETSIRYKNTYEVLVEKDYMARSKLDTHEYIDEENGYTYRFGCASNEYALVFLIRLSDYDFHQSRRFSAIPIDSSYLEKRVDSFQSIFDVFNFMVRRIDTISIETEHVLSDKQLKSLIDGLTFEIAFNTGAAVTHVKYFKELFIPMRLTLRKKRLEEIEAPKRKYIEELIYHYQMGLSTHQPALKFTSFYHVMEYFFSEVFNEKIVQDVRKEITSPKFSSKRSSDINKLIKNIKKNIKIELDENVGKSEKEALKLTLTKYVNIDELKNILMEIDVNQIDYYVNNEVEFSSGPKVNFLCEQEDTIINALSNRIYKTRNAVVHSKAESKECYTPFKHENQLLNEIPLVQIIAEEIIINTSRIL